MTIYTGVYTSVICNCNFSCVFFKVRKLWIELQYDDVRTSTICSWVVRWIVSQRGDRSFIQ